MIRNKNRIRYLSFKRKNLGKYIDADGYYGYQCVDLIRHYCWEVFNFNMGKLPSAKDANNINTFPGRKRLVVGTDDLWSGDIIIFGPTKNNKHGHIAIVDKRNSKGIYILEQNGSGIKSGAMIPGNEVRIRFVPRGNVLNVFRKEIE